MTAHAAARAAAAGAGAGRRLRQAAPGLTVDEFTALTRRTGEMLARTAHLADPGSHCDYSEDPATPEACATCHALASELCRLNATP